MIQFATTEDGRSVELTAEYWHFLRHMTGDFNLRRWNEENLGTIPFSTHANASSLRTLQTGFLAEVNILQPTEQRPSPDFARNDA